MTLEDLGYTASFEAQKIELGLGAFPIARVISESRGAYRVRHADGEYLAKMTGTHMFKATAREDYPAVGDWVAIEAVDKNHAVIRGILPRHTIIKRIYREKTQIIATNIDIAFIIESVDRDYSLNRFERYFALAKDGGVTPAIILNKIDLIRKDDAEQKMSQLKTRFPDIDIIFTSTIREDGLAELKAYIKKAQTYCFLGSSGVGKSTLINTLLNEHTIKTGSIGSHSRRGMHVTTSRHMYVLANGAIVIDNPGMREVAVADAEEGVDAFFEEIATVALGCQYTDCSHSHEPGCAVLRALEAGTLDKDKFANYANLKKEAAFHELDNVEKREKNRRFGKFKNTALKELRDVGHKDL